MTVRLVVHAAPTQAPRSALDEFEALLGPDGAHSDDATLGRYARSASTEPGHRPVAVLLPQTQEEVLAIVEIAGRHRVPLYPVSGGRNWGYGDARPSGRDQFIVDLKRMNRILEVNVALGYAVIEPGVSQGQLHEYLVENFTGLWADSTGAGPDASVMGNTLDRGFGHTRIGDHFQNSCGMEVVLANGTLLKTGFGHYDNARTTWVYKHGVGPVLDGLFSQSNFGIVTKLGVWLIPQPESFCAWFAFVERHDQLPELVDALGTLKREGLLQSCVHIGNDLRVLSSRTGYPFERTQGQTPLADDLRGVLRKEHGITPWAATGILTGSPEVVRALRKTLKRRLAGFKLVILDDQRLRWAERAARLLEVFGLAKKARAQLAVVRPLYDYLKGVPNHDAIKGTQWRVRGEWLPHLTDPLSTPAGFMWVSPIVPLVGDEALHVANLIGPIYQKHGFDPLISCTLISERALCVVTNIAFDKRVPEEVANARACYAELTSTLKQRGYPLYRTGPEGFEHLSEASKNFWNVVEQLKRTLDPHDIMSPGRYTPVRGEALQ